MAFTPVTNRTSLLVAQALPSSGSKPTNTSPVTTATDRRDVFSVMGMILSPETSSSSHSIDQAQPSTWVRNVESQTILAESLVLPSDTAAIAAISQLTIELLPSSQSESAAVANVQASTATAAIEEALQSMVELLPSSQSESATVENVQASTATAATAETLQSAIELLPSSQSESAAVANVQAPIPTAAFTSQDSPQTSVTSLYQSHTASTTSKNLLQAVQTVWSLLDSSLSNAATLPNPVTSQMSSSSNTIKSTHQDAQLTSKIPVLIDPNIVLTISGDNSLVTSFPTTSSTLLTSSASTKTRPNGHHHVDGHSLSTGSATLVQPTDGSNSSSPPSSDLSESPTGNSSHRAAALAAGLSVGCLVLLGLIVAILIYRRRKGTNFEDIGDGTMAPLSGSAADRENQIDWPLPRGNSPVANFPQRLKTVATNRTHMWRGRSASIPSLRARNPISPSLRTPQPPAAAGFFGNLWKKHGRQGLTPEMQEVTGETVPHPNYLEILVPIDGAGDLASWGNGQERNALSPQMLGDDSGDHLQHQHINAPDHFTKKYHRSQATPLSMPRTESPISKQPSPFSPFELCHDMMHLPSERSSVNTGDRLRRGRSDPFDLESITFPVGVFAPSPLQAQERRGQGSDGSTTPISFVSSLTGFEDSKSQERQPGNSYTRSNLGLGPCGVGDRNTASRSSADSEVLGILG